MRRREAGAEGTEVLGFASREPSSGGMCDVQLGLVLGGQNESVKIYCCQTGLQQGTQRDPCHCEPVQNKTWGGKLKTCFTVFFPYLNNWLVSSRRSIF